MALPVSDDLRKYARELGQQYGLSPEFVDAIGSAESNWKPNALSPKGAIGPMQLMPATAQMLGVDPSDPYDNIRGGVQYLKQLHTQFKGDHALVAAAYNAGPGAVQKAGGVPNYPETQKYVQKVTQAMQIDPRDVTVDQINPADVTPDKRGSPADEMGRGEAALVAAGRGFTKLGRGVQDIYYSAKGDQSARNQLDALEQADKARYQPLADKYPLVTGLSETAPSALLGPVGMALEGALQYGTPEERAKNAAAGFVGGKVGQYAGKAIGRVAQPIRDTASDLFNKFDVKGTVGQVTGSRPMQWIESTLAQLPGGGRMRAAAEESQTSLNRAAMKQMGSDAEMVTPEAVAAGKQAIGPKFDAASKPVTVRNDDTMLNGLATVETDYMKNLSPDQKGIVKQYLDDILAHGDNISGESYQKWRSRIGARAETTQDSELKSALKGLQKAMDGAYDRSASPDAAALMKEARSQWTAAKALDKITTPEGNVSAARLATVAKGKPGDLGELAKLASKMKAMPMSGTAERLMYQSLLSGGVGGITGLATGDPEQALKYAGGTFAAPWLASQLLTRAPVKNYLTKGLFDVTPEVEKWLARLGGTGGGLLGLSAAK